MQFKLGYQNRPIIGPKEQIDSPRQTKIELVLRSVTFQLKGILISCASNDAMEQESQNKHMYFSNM